MNIKKYIFESIWLWFVLFATIVGIVSFAYNADIENKKNLQQIFESQQSKITENIEHTIVNYEQLLRGGRGLYAASNYVDRSEWKAYADMLNLEAEFSGIRAFAYARVLSHSEKEEYERHTVEEGFSEFKIYPEGDRERYVPATYLEPFNEIHQSVHGYDMWSEESRRSAMILAAESNRSVISSNVVLVEDAAENSHESGILMFLPVYKHNVSKQNYTVEDVEGYVYGLFRVSNIIDPVAKHFPDIRLEIFDGNAVNQNERIFASKHSFDTDAVHALQNTKTIVVAQREWTLMFTTTSAFAPDVDRYLPVKILIVGFLLCLLSFVALLLLRRAKRFAEIVAAERTLELAQSEAQFRTAMEYSPVGKALVGLNGEWLKVNKSLCAMLGYFESELLETDFQKLTHPDDLEADLEKVQELLDGKINTYRMEKRYIRKDGEVIWGLLSVSLLRDANGNPRHFISQIQDISDIKNTQRRLEELNVELEEFSYRTSHDLRSPLMSGIGLLRFSKDALEKGQGDKAEESISLALNSLTKLDALLADILDLARVKNADEEPQYVDVEALVDDALEKLSHMENFDRLDVQVDIKPDVQIFTKKTRFLMIVENMISNSIKYQDTGKKKSTLKIEAAQKKGAFIFAVEDNGLGIPEDQQKNLFAMFKRFHPKVSFGSGLGMYMMRKSADVIGGEIQFVKQKDGARFELVLPKEAVFGKKESVSNVA